MVMIISCYKVVGGINISDIDDNYYYDSDDVVV